MAMPKRLGRNALDLFDELDHRYLERQIREYEQSVQDRDEILNRIRKMGQTARLMDIERNDPEMIQWRESLVAAGLVGDFARRRLIGAAVTPELIEGEVRGVRWLLEGHETALQAGSLPPQVVEVLQPYWATLTETKSAIPLPPVKVEP